MRVDLPGGHWAELRDRLDYGSARLVRVAFLVAEEDRALLADVDLALVRAYLIEWDLDTPISTPELADDDAIQAIAKRALAIWNGKRDPKASGLRSVESSTSSESPAPGVSA